MQSGGQLGKIIEQKQQESRRTLPEANQRQYGCNLVHLGNLFCLMKRKRIARVCALPAARPKAYLLRNKPSRRSCFHVVWCGSGDFF